MNGRYQGVVEGGGPVPTGYQHQAQPPMQNIDQETRENYSYGFLHVLEYFFFSSSKCLFKF